MRIPKKNAVSIIRHYGDCGTYRKSSKFRISAAISALLLGGIVNGDGDSNGAPFRLVWVVRLDCLIGDDAVNIYRKGW